jgi:putative membrane protein
MMHWFGNYGFCTGFGGIFMILFWAIVIFIVIALVKKAGPGEKETAEDILKKRYARGEISQEEFERLKKEIGE